MSRIFPNGEIMLSKRIPFIDSNSRLVDFPPELMTYADKLYAKDSPVRFYKRPTACWVNVKNHAVNQKGEPYPRAYNAEGKSVSLRKIIAQIFFDYSSAPCDPDEVRCVMTCGNPDCLQPRHMRFGNRPNLRLGLD